MLLITIILSATACKKIDNTPKTVTLEIRDYATKSAIPGLTVSVSRLVCNQSLQCQQDHIGDYTTNRIGMFTVEKQNVYGLVSLDNRYFNPYRTTNFTPLDPGSPPPPGIVYFFPSSTITLKLRSSGLAANTATGNLSWAILTPDIPALGVQDPYEQMLTLPRDSSITINAAGGADNLLHMILSPSSSPRQEKIIHVTPPPQGGTTLEILY